MPESPMSARDYQLALRALNKLAIDKSLDSITGDRNKSTATMDCASPDDSFMEPFSPEIPCQEPSYPETPSTIDDMDYKNADKLAQLHAEIATLKAEKANLKAENRELSGQVSVRDVEIAAFKDATRKAREPKKPKSVESDWKIRPSHYPGVDFEFYRDGNPQVKIKNAPKRLVLPEEWDQKDSPK
ncbi:hypothetical protein MBLNU457_5396t1 [Dothideomycetes sp. NU457]